MWQDSLHVVVFNSHQAETTPVFTGGMFLYTTSFSLHLAIEDKPENLWVIRFVCG